MKAKIYRTWIAGIQVDKNYNTFLNYMYALSSSLTLLSGFALPALINCLLFILVIKKQVLAYVETIYNCPTSYERWVKLLFIIRLCRKIIFLFPSICIWGPLGPFCLYITYFVIDFWIISLFFFWLVFPIGKHLFLLSRFCFYFCIVVYI